MISDHVRLLTTGVVNFPYLKMSEGNNNYQLKEKN